MSAPPPQRSAGGSARAGERHAEERCCSSPPCCSTRGLLPSYTPLRFVPAGGGGLRGRADKSGRLSWWSPAWGSARGRGRMRGAKKSLFAPHARWLVSTDLSLLPGAANAASLKPGRWRSCALSRLVILEFTPTCAVTAGTCCLCMVVLLSVAVVLAASLPEAVKGRRF